MTAEMLKSITYPTHGRTEFIYEPNVISSMVSADRKTVQSAHLPYPGTPDYTYPGGLRIKEINNYDSNDELLTRKHYYYTKEFTPTTKEVSLPVFYLSLHNTFGVGSYTISSNHKTEDPNIIP